MSEVLRGLDDQQREVATTFGCPVAVIAGAGTGKTRAITHRIAYGAQSGSYDPRAVLAVTFTTKAAGEMRARLRGLGFGFVQARTFHSAALRQAQYFWPKVMGTVLPAVTDRNMSLVAESGRRIGMKLDKGAIRDAVSEISWAKVSNVLAEDYPQVAQELGRRYESFTATELALLSKAYEQTKRDRQVLDFDDILLTVVGLLAEHPRIASEVRNTYRHLIVDEYQDVSPLQQALLTLWLGETGDLCVVGDPAQTIHTFAGASHKYLTQFLSRQPNAKIIRLVRDYRSTPEIVSWANRVSAPMNLGAVRLLPVRDSGPEPVLTACASESDEAERTAQWFLDLAKDGVPWREMAVLYRINSQSPALEAALTDNDIPYVVRGAEGFFDRGEVRQALKLFASQDVEPIDAMAAALDKMGWTSTAPEGGGSLRERWESLAALQSLVEDMLDEDPELTLAEVVDEFRYRQDSSHAPEANAVTLSTIHSAKGQEWEAVSVIGVQEGLLPYVLAKDPEEVDEERRLMYVAITRAKTHLSLSWSVGRNGTRRVSRFLADVGLATSVPVPVARRRKSALASVCRVCQGRLSGGAERKLGRHLDCESSYDEVLWEALRSWRLEVSRVARQPAFVVFTDATLLTIAETEPDSLRALSKISGVGAAKLAKYGESVLDIIRSHRGTGDGGTRS